MHKDISTELFDLIHSMTKGEKRYFKLYSHTRSPLNTDKNYLSLFDAIEKQKEFNEEKIRKLGIVKNEHLPMLKNYLYNLVLESLRALRAKGDSIDNKIANLLENARIMQDKGLEKEEIKFLEKAKQLALKYERWGTAMEALFIERRIVTRKESAKPWRKIDNEIKDLMYQVTDLTKHLFLSREVKILMNKSGANRKDHQRSVKKLCADPLLKTENKNSSLEAKRTRYLTLCNYYSFLDENQKSYETLVKAVDLVESNILVFGNPDITFAKSLTNLIITQFELGKYDEAFKNIQKYRVIATKPGPAKVFAFVYSVLLEAYYYFRASEFEKGVIVVKRIEKELEVVKPPYPTQLHFLYFYIANIYFGAAHYRKALQWINKIVNQPKTILREDMQAFSRILQLIIHFELGDKDILKHLVISSSRFLSKRKQLFKVEESILRFMRRLDKVDDSRKNLLNEYVSLRNELAQITKNPEEKKSLEYFDLISWVESKIENKAFAEVVKENAAIKV